MQRESWYIIRTKLLTQKFIFFMSFVTSTYFKSICTFDTGSDTIASFSLLNLLLTSKNYYFKFSGKCPLSTMPLHDCRPSTTQSFSLQKFIQCLINWTWITTFNAYFGCTECGGKWNSKEISLVCGLHVIFVSPLSIQMSKSRNTTFLLNLRNPNFHSMSD